MTAWARVSVAGPESTVDVGLPTDLPIADFIDDLVLRVSGPPDVIDGSREWTLRPLGSDSLAPAQTLRDGGVCDGTWLVLQEGPAEDPAVLIDDTLDALTELTDARHGSWSPRAAEIAGAGAATAATVVGAAGLVLARCAGSTTTQLLATVIAALGAMSVLAAAVYRGRSGERATPIGGALCAMATALATAAGFAAVPGPPAAASTLLAAVAATACAAITLRATGIAPVPQLALIATGVLAAVPAALATAGMGRAHLAALLAVLALLVTLAAPRLTVVLAKIPLPPVPSPGEPIDAVEAPLLPTIEAVDAISLGALPDIDALTRRAEHARQYLTGLCLGAAAVAAVAVAAAGVDTPDWRFTVIAVGVGLVFVLRGRSHTDLAQAAALIAGGLLGIFGFLMAAMVSAPQSRSFGSATAALAVAALAILIGGWAAGRTFSPLQRRAAELAEYGLLVLLLPLLLWALEIYRMIREAW